MHWAARKGLRDGVICLLEAGADFDLRNNEGKRPIDVADSDEVTRLELKIKYNFLINVMCTNFEGLKQKFSRMNTT